MSLMDKVATYKKLVSEVENCRKCELWKTRKYPVVGEGPLDAKIMLVGLGPGYHENLQGRPFVGAAGKFLNHLLELAGLDRSGIYITNVVKCYLPDNKATEEQIEACTPYLDRQVELIKPKLIVALGSVAAKYLLSKFKLPYSSMGRLHGKFYRVRSLTLDFDLAVMYHPASALYNPSMRIILENDWRKLGDYIKSLRF